MGYISRSREVVLQALKVAYSLKERPVSSREVSDIGSRFPEVPFQGGWSPFDLLGRTKRFLDFLVRNGDAEVEIRGRTSFYKPTDLEINEDLVDLLGLEVKEVEGYPDSHDRLLGLLR